MAVGGIYRLKVVSSLGSGDEILNIFHYLLQSDDSAVPQTEGELCDQLINGFSDHVLGPWLDIVSAQWRVERLEADNISGFAFSTSPAGAGYEGHVAGESLPRFVSYNIMLQRTTSEHRNGHKRICGVPEGWQNTGTFTGDSVKMGDFLETLSDVLNPVEGSVSTFWLPVIARYNTGHTAVVSHNLIAGASFRGFGSQNSRKS